MESYKIKMIYVSNDEKKDDEGNIYKAPNVECIGNEEYIEEFYNNEIKDFDKYSYENQYNNNYNNNNYSSGSSHKQNNRRYNNYYGYQNNYKSYKGYNSYNNSQSGDNETFIYHQNDYINRVCSDGTQNRKFPASLTQTCQNDSNKTQQA